MLDSGGAAARQVSMCFSPRTPWISEEWPEELQESRESWAKEQHAWYSCVMREFILYQDDSGQWTAECKEMPGYRVKGKTEEEALAKIKSALLTFYPCRCEE